MPRDVFVFSCPCCGKRVEVNVKSGKARAAKPEERHGDLDSLLEKQKSEAERLGGLFDEARGDHATERERLEKMFGDAKKAADEDEDKGRPPSPFDLD